MKQESGAVLQPAILNMEPQRISLDVLAEKYAKGDENSIQDVRRRVAKTLAGVEQKDHAVWEEIFFQNQENGFVPAGRINSAAGMDLRATLINCFVQPVGDCISGHDDDGYPSIYLALSEAAETMRRGGGVGYDFSRIRPLLADVKGTKSRASGPLSYMRVFDRSCETVESAGARRGAQMGILRCDHPDIMAFIKAKDKEGEFSNFNLSIGVTDAFMEAVENDLRWKLVHKAKPNKTYAEEHDSYQIEELGIWVWRTLPAREIWEVVMRSTYDHAEPGILFIDQMNKENNLWYCEKIEATNPCAEQPLPPYGCCDLGSLNLTRFVRLAFTDKAYFDFDAFADATKTSVRMLDNVLDATEWALEKQRMEAMNKRRIGLGFLGLGDAIVMLGRRYDRENGRDFAKEMAATLRDNAYIASVELAKEKGSFPFFNAEKFLEGAFAKRLPEYIREMIREHGLRNSHLLSIAPTGTITLAFADNASNGIEPPFSWVYDRKKRSNAGVMETFEVADYAWRLYRAMGHDMTKLPENFVTALEMPVEPHVEMMKVVQPFCDTSISKTVNIPVDYPYEDFKDLYMKAWKAGLKGLATYRPNDVTGSILSVKEDKTVAPVVTEDTTAEDNGKTLEQIVDEMYRESFDSREDGRLPGFTIKNHFYTQEGIQKFLLNINILTIKRKTRFGVVTIRRPVEFVLKANFAIRTPAWESTMRLASLSARMGAPLPKVIDNMTENAWNSGAVRYGTRIKDGREVPMWHDSDVAALGYAIEQGLKEEGYLTEDGKPSKRFTLEPENDGGFVEMPKIWEGTAASFEVTPEAAPKNTGKKCGDCGAYAVVKRDGCELCEACGWSGACG
ncbi:MAG TPA: adenosylcobalamin-dependent ribonucleoside-diphosphate reductase [Pyrinomonadaceae bacterium]|nr:adenosylcobalamin-dependent ribonucleoside-diphosphate reductase [Pyrinomonadaceae bacterium]